MIYAYYGLGQGKSSTLNGMCLRAIASQQTILFARFFKGRKSAENDILQKLGINVICFQTSKHFIWTTDLKEREKIIAQAQAGIAFLKTNCSAYEYIFLDEALDLVTNKIMTTRVFCEFVKELSQNRKVFISGHYMNQQIKAVCDVVTHYKKMKHHFDNGIGAIKFVDF